MAYYELGITHNIRVTKYKKCNTWDAVIDYLRNHIPSWTVCITIYKRYPCGKSIANRTITMGDLYEVASSPTDEVLKQ